MSSFDLGCFDHLSVTQELLRSVRAGTLVYKSVHKWMQYAMIRYSTDGEHLHNRHFHGF